MRRPLLLAGTLAAAACARDPQAIPVDLTTEGEVAPLSVDVSSPRLAWRLSPTGASARQAAYALEVRREPGGELVWSSGAVRSDATRVAYAGPALAPGEAHAWRVRLEDAAGRWSGPSAWARFETAPDTAGWTARWIGRDEPRPGLTVRITPSPLLRKAFTLPTPAVRAVLRVAGLGLHEVAIDGARVGDDVLGPAFTAYDRRVAYDTYDVTALLGAGAHALAVRLGRGFYATSGLDGYGWNQAAWNAPHALLLQLDVTLASGETVRVASDAGWRVADGPTRSDGVRTGEHHDAREEPAGWTRPGFDDGAWAAAEEVAGPRGALRARVGPPVRVVETVTPVAVTSPSPGVKVFDLGRVTAGWARVTLRGLRGDGVSLRYGEKLLADGAVDASVMYAGPQEDAYVLAGGGDERWEPRFTWHGFRYVEVRGAPEIVALEGRVVHADVPHTGTFESSSPLLDAIWAAQRRTIEHNLQSVPTDSPQYEKSGWAADGWLWGRSALLLLGVERFHEKWLADWRDAQRADGALGVMVPWPGAGPFAPYLDDPLWSGAHVLLAWDLYQERGDLRVLEENHDLMRRWLDRAAGLVEPAGWLWTGHTYGDWLNPGAGSDDVLLASAALSHEARTFAAICRALGRVEEAPAYDGLADRIAAAVNARFFDPARNVYQAAGAPYRQASNGVAVAWGIVPEGRVRAVVDGIADDVAARGDHLSTGAFGTKVLLPVLTAHGHGDLAVRLALQTTYPSWGYLVGALGADTLWEGWGGDERSRDHAFLGSIVDWMVADLAGVQPIEPGYRRLRVAPFVPGAGLDHAAASVETPHGRAAVRWRRGAGIEVEVPPNTGAEIRVPAALPGRCDPGMRPVRSEPGATVYEAGPGRHGCGRL
ncbi:MAG: family 78 glycoside hydrolase catalytic domain [Anaeromyxobacter sp.]